MVLTNHFYLMIVTGLHTVIWSLVADNALKNYNFKYLLIQII